MTDWVAEQIALTIVVAMAMVVVGVLFGLSVRVWLWAKRPLDEPRRELWRP